jgi:3-mercaptopyruvate sulfurtransferase SseA
MKYIIFYLLLNQFLFGNNSVFTESKVAIKLIDKKDIQFISAQKNMEEIKGSKIVDVKALSSSHILGKMPCAPYLLCPKSLEKILSKQNITFNQQLVIYDDSYGIYAAWLYNALESMGHRNMLILNGGVKSIMQIDPNQETYNKYSDELNSLLKSQENNESNKEIESLNKKLKVLKPLLLVQKKEKLFDKTSISASTYEIGEKSSEYFLTKKELKEASAIVRSRKELNITIVDVCPMVNIVGNNTGSYESELKTLSWKEIINTKEKSLKPIKTIKNIFEKSGLDQDKNIYLYCMSGSAKALFMMTVMREVGYLKVKAFTGDWNVWIGDKYE